MALGGNCCDKWAPVGTGTGEKAYYQRKNGLLEPSSYEKPQFNTFTYTGAVGSRRCVTSSFATSLSASGRLEVRSAGDGPLDLVDSQLTGLQASSMALITDPWATTYPDPKGDYYRRLALAGACKTKYLAFPAALTTLPFIPGPYGSFVTRITIFNLTWFVGRNFGGAYGFPFENETGDDGAVDYMRWDKALRLLLTKGTVAAIGTGDGGGVGAPLAGVAFVNLPRSWSAQPTCVFEDDFMAAALDAGAWTVTESSAGNVQIDPQLAAVKGIGNNSYTGNGMLSVASYARSSGYHYEADTWVGQPAIVPGSAQVFGVSNGVGVNLTNYAHGIVTGDTGYNIYELGSSVAAGALDNNTMFRLRITPGAVNGALYEAQGGTIWPKLGGASFATLLDTRGISAVSTASLKLGYTPYYAPNTGGGQYLSHVKVYA